MVNTILDPRSEPKFVNDLPTLPVLDATWGGNYTIQIKQGEQWLGLVDANGNRLYTTIRGYACTAPGSLDTRLR